MPTVIGYAPNGIVYTPGSNSWSVQVGFDPRLHRVEFSFVDGVICQFDHRTGQSSLSGHVAKTADGGGHVIARGRICADSYYEVEGPGGDLIYLDCVEIDGVHVGYITSAPLQPGVSYPLLGARNVTDAHATSHLDRCDVPCFGTNSRVMTQKGEVPIAWLSRGDKVLTRDYGYQPLRWSGRFQVPLLRMRRNTRLAPVRIWSKLVDPEAPFGFVEVSPDHQVLLGGADVQLLFGEDEVLAPARFLSKPRVPAVSQAGYVYHHLLFTRHQVIQVNGIWSESLFVPPPDPLHLPETGLYPPRGVFHSQAARPCLTRAQVALLMAERRRRGGDMQKHRA